MTSGPDPLRQVDAIVHGWRSRLDSSVAHADEITALRQEFVGKFLTTCQTVVRPAMETVLERLTHDGGGGRVEVHDGHEPRWPTPRIVLWMSLDGPLEGTPREDRHAYLRLDADPVRAEVQVREGDMWRGGGTHSSGPAGTWALEDITEQGVEARLVAILQRAAR